MSKRTLRKQRKRTLRKQRKRTSRKQRRRTLRKQRKRTSRKQRRGTKRKTGGRPDDLDREQDNSVYFVSRNQSGYYLRVSYNFTEASGQIKYIIPKGQQIFHQLKPFSIDTNFISVDDRGWLMVEKAEGVRWSEEGWNEGEPKPDPKLRYWGAEDYYPWLTFEEARDLVKKEVINDDTEVLIDNMPDKWMPFSQAKVLLGWEGWLSSNGSETCKMLKAKVTDLGCSEIEGKERSDDPKLTKFKPMRKLMSEAKALGVKDVDIEAIDEEDDPKGALADLIRAHHPMTPARGGGPKENSEIKPNASERRMKLTYNFKDPDSDSDSATKKITKFLSESRSGRGGEWGRKSLEVSVPIVTNKAGVLFSLEINLIDLTARRPRSLTAHLSRALKYVKKKATKDASKENVSKKWLTPRYYERYSNLLSTIFCMLKNIGLEIMNITKMEWENQDPNRRGRSYGEYPYHDYKYGYKIVGATEVEGAWSTVTHWKPTEGGPGAATARQHGLEGAVVIKDLKPEPEKKPSGSDGEPVDTFKNFKTFALVLCRAAAEIMIQWQIQKGTENVEGKKHISEIKKLLWQHPSKHFIARMMKGKLRDDNEFLLPSIIMEDAGITLYSCFLNRSFSPRHMQEATTDNMLNYRLQFLKEIALGLSFMNANDFYHQDVKTENICVKTGTNGSRTIKIIDFGFSKKYGKTVAKQKKQNVGNGSTWYFRSNEKSWHQALGRRAGRLDLCDIWAYLIISTLFFWGAETPVGQPDGRLQLDAIGLANMSGSPAMAGYTVYPETVVKESTMKLKGMIVYLELRDFFYKLSGLNYKSLDKLAAWAKQEWENDNGARQVVHYSPTHVTEECGYNADEYEMIKKLFKVYTGGDNVALDRDTSILYCGWENINVEPIAMWNNIIKALTPEATPEASPEATPKV
tara:strand:+ start:1912 stop:4659 length:2748 start_codon:yes stop_codon:yes gene_type:complete